MGLVRFGGGVIQISGSIAGTVHARNRFGNYIRPRTKPVNPNTVGQTLCRSLMAYLTGFWNQSVTPTEQIAWNTYAAAVAFKNRLGETVYLTGFNHFVRYMTIWYRKTSVPSGEAPSVLALPQKDPTFAVAASVANGLSVTYDITQPWYTIAQSAIVVYQGQPQLKTRNFFGGPWKLAGYCDMGVTSPHIITPPPFTLVLGQKVWCYGRIMTGLVDRRLSEPMYSACIVGV